MTAFAVLLSNLQVAQSVRHTRGHVDEETGELAWIVHERTTMFNAVNGLRRERGLDPVSLDEVKRAESLASGHSDYTRKFALGCAELVDRDEPVSA